MVDFGADHSRLRPNENAGEDVAREVARKNLKGSKGHRITHTKWKFLFSQMKIQPHHNLKLSHSSVVTSNLHETTFGQN